LSCLVVCAGLAGCPAIGQGDAPGNELGDFGTQHGAIDATRGRPGSHRQAKNKVEIRQFVPIPAEGLADEALGQVAGNRRAQQLLRDDET